MKIIKMGKVDSQKGICPHCGCEYEYEYGDIYNSYELTSQYKYVICPCCGRQNIINTISYPHYPDYPFVTYCSTDVSPSGLTIKSEDVSSHIPYIEGVELNTDGE